ncbi:MAG TPA: polyprenyl synthetase family protein [Thermoanaerobaculia bacterium]|nr:polyprenyl synthetase family protein [Thermoanaerobaculia bacterium]
MPLRPLSTAAESSAAATPSRSAATDTAPTTPPEHFLGLVAPKLAATEEIFRRSLDSDVPFIHKAGEYLATGGGKRVRPALLLLTARMLGHDGEEEVTYAAVVELIHTATLVHDDVIDHSGLRRGRETVNRLWGNNLTVLLGDWIYTLAMQKALSHDRLEVVQRLVGATLKMVEGELLALERLGSIDLTAEEYFRIIDRKTAHLFSAACSVPALIPPRRAGAETALGRYGEHLGVCFQIIDDLLDFTAREDELGKPVLSDLKEGKLTLPLILLLPRIAPAERDRIRHVLEDRAFRRAAADDILALVEREGTLDEAAALAEDHAERARRELDPFPDNDAREALLYAPDFILTRRS